MKDIFRWDGWRYARITPIQQLKARIAELEKENTDLLESNANLAFQVDELESTINILNNTNEGLRAEIDDWINQ